ncbi:MAG: ClpXP protease specificity-enhancing factor SspB [Candidatus Izemoplasma sp.]
MSGSKYYLVEAMHRWITDTNGVPEIMVRTDFKDLMIPPGLGQNGVVVFNISYSSTLGLKIDEEGIMFSAMFSGISQNLYIPMQSLISIFPRGNRREGLIFNLGSHGTAETEALDKPGFGELDHPKVFNKPKLKIVSSNKKIKKTKNLKNLFTLV